MVYVGGAGATTVDTRSGAPLMVMRARHGSYVSTDMRAGAAPEIKPSVATSGAGGGALVINVTFDSTITSDPNAASIEAMINDAVSVHESLFSDPIVVSIRFRYATTYADGTPLPAGLLAASESGVHVIPWNTFLGALTADATTANDATANGTLSGSALSVHVDPSSASGRAIGLSTPPVMFADGSLGPGGPYDGIVIINADAAFAYTRPPGNGIYDARRSVEHEIDEVLGLGSAINRSNDLRPQDLFSWSSAGVRNLTPNGPRYFSIDGGNTSIVGFNQNPNGDFGDWLSGPCPQANPYVQNAFSCDDQVSDVTQTSPEGINLDVIGYDLVTPQTSTIPTTSTTVTTLPCPPPRVECCPVGAPGCGVCGTDCGNGGCCGPSTPVCDNANGLCLVCAPPQVECCPGGGSGCGVCGTDCGNGACCPPSDPVCDNVNDVCLVSGPTCTGGQVPCTDTALGFADVACCSEPTKKKQCAAACSPIISACKLSCAPGRGLKKCTRRCRTVIVGHCKRTRPHACS